MEEPLEFDPVKLQDVLTQFESLSYDPPELGQREFQSIWTRHGKHIEAFLRTGPRELNKCLDALERFAKTRPALDISATDLAYADPALLSRLECAYDVWFLLAENGRQLCIRGEEKEGHDWDEHEKPLTESYRWEVKARLATGPKGTQARIKHYQQAAAAARPGKTHVCRNRVRHMEAHAIHHMAFDILRTGRDESVFDRAAELFAQARDLVKPKTPEEDSGAAPRENFFHQLCRLQAAELALDLDAASGALKEALKSANNVRRPETLFKTPNPWTSFKDLKNEAKFILALRALINQSIIYIALW